MAMATSTAKMWKPCTVKPLPQIGAVGQAHRQTLCGKSRIAKSFLYLVLSAICFSAAMQLFGPNVTISAKEWTSNCGESLPDGHRVAGEINTGISIEISTVENDEPETSNMQPQEQTKDRVSHTGETEPEVNLADMHTANRPVKQCIIAVASSVQLLETLNLAQLRSWVPEVEKVCDVRFYVGQGHISQKAVVDFGNRLVQVVAADEYPPREKVFYLWADLYNHIHMYRWFIKADSDTYINAKSLKKMLEIYDETPERYGYTGKPGTGIPSERARLGIIRPYCQGMGYIMSRDMLSKIGENLLGECIGDFRSNHSDTEIGRCVANFGGAGCKNTPDPYTSEQMYWYIHDGVIRMAQKLANMQVTVSPTMVPPSFLFSGTFVHPFKTPDQFTDFHRYVQLNIRPVIGDPVCHESISPEVCDAALKRTHRSCVNNPSAQLEITKGSVYLRECPSPAAEQKPNLNVPVYVMSLDTPEGLEGFKVVERLLKNAGFPNVIRYHATNGREAFGTSNVKGSLKPGELGYRDTMRRIFEDAKAKNIPRVIIVDDDAKPRKNFKRYFKEIMAETRCGGHMWTENQGGILMLGGTVWHNGTYPVPNKERGWYAGWNLIDADMRNASAHTHHTPARLGSRRHMTKCYNANAASLGSFAGMYHRGVYDSILQWLRTVDDKPFDHMFGALGQKGHIVRVAYPNLFIPDVGHKSSVNPGRTSLGQVDRSAIHRWKLENYCWKPKCK